MTVAGALLPRLLLPICAVGVTAPELPGGRDDLDLDSCQGCQLSSCP